MSHNSERFYDESEDGDILPLDHLDHTDIIYSHPDTTEYMVARGVKSEDLMDVSGISDAATPLFLAPDLPPSANESKQTKSEVAVEKLPIRDRLDRLTGLKRDEGFYPQGNPEFNRMMLMSGNADTPHRALIHLDEVYARQRSLFVGKEMAARSGIATPEAQDKKQRTPQEEAIRTLNAIVREFENNAQDARVLRSFVGSLNERIQGLELNNRATFKNISQLKDWKYEESTSRALMAVAKYIETQNFVENDGEDPLGKKVIIDNDKHREARIASRVDNLRVTELSNYCSAVIDNQSMRFDYWVSRLQESTKHLYVRGQAYKALRNLGVIK